MNLLKMNLTGSYWIKYFKIFLTILRIRNSLESFQPLPTYLDVRASKFEADKFFVPSDPRSLSYQTTLALQVEVEEVDNPRDDLSTSHPTLPTQDFCANLDCNSNGCDVVLSPHPPSSNPVVLWILVCCFHLSQI